MKKSILAYLVFSMFLVIGFTGCDSEDSVSNDNELVGNYTLFYMKDKSTDITLMAGQTNNYMGAEITITGTLELTDNTYDLNIAIHTKIGNQTSDETEHDLGSYTKTGSTLTFSSADGESDTVNYVLDGNDLTIENDESKTFFTKN